MSSPHQREHGGHGPTLLFRDTGKLIQAHAHVRLCVCVLVGTQLCEVSCLGLTRAVEPKSRHPSVLQPLLHSHCCLHGGADLYTQVGTQVLRTSNSDLGSLDRHKDVKYRE